MIAQADQTRATTALNEIEQVVSLTEARFNAGEVAGTELRRLQVERLHFFDQVLTTELAVSDARVALLNLLGAADLQQLFEATDPLAAPIDAVQQIDGQPVVFVRTGPTTFERRDVSLGSTADGLVEVVSGLRPGESIVSTGSFYLKTALLHERIGHSH